MEDCRLFEKCTIGGITFQNRILRAATAESMADEQGRPTEKLTKLYTDLAKGGVGGIITGYIAVSEDGKNGMPGMCSLHTDENTMAFRSMVREVHELHTPIIAQIAHCGMAGVGGKKYNINKMSQDQIEQIREEFVQAAVRCHDAGFDGVELHCAHGYFLSTMISGATNHRRDIWGGMKENRIMLVERMIREIKKELPDYPVFVKLNGEELVKNGVTPAEASFYAARMEAAGADAIEVSRGLQSTPFDPMRGQAPVAMMMQDYPKLKKCPSIIKKLAYPLLVKGVTPPPPYHLFNLEAAEIIRKKVSIPIILVGGICNKEECIQALEMGMDMVSVCRPFILEPQLVKKWKEGLQEDSKCIQCNYCLIGICNRPLRCYYGNLPKRT